MGLASSVAVAAAERVERTGGARAGLAVWRKVAESATDGPTRATALLAAMRCAVHLTDGAALEGLAASWEAVQAGIYEEVFALLRGASRAGLASAATALARAESTRHRSARALYAYARCLELAGEDARAEAALNEAIARAVNEGVAGLEHGARLRRAVILGRSPERTEEALSEARRVDPGSASPRERLALARLLLGSSSRFVRAGAIDLLDPVVCGADRGLADVALAVLAAHADSANDALTPLEADRLLALFGRPAVAGRAAPARAVIAVLARLAAVRTLPEASRREALERAMRDAVTLAPELAPLHVRARDLESGRLEPHVAAAHRPAEARGATPASVVDTWGAVLDLAFALRDGAHARAAHVLCGLRERAAASRRGAGEPPPPVVWTLLSSALQAEHAEVRSAGVELAAALFAGGAPPEPPRGWLAVATALVLAGREDLADCARRLAAARGEPGAEDALALALTRSAWQLASAGERARALTLLREARRRCCPNGT